MKQKIYLTLALLFAFGTYRSNSQCLMVETSLSERVQQSTAIFEGKVISNSSFWNEEHTNIFTSNFIEVYKVFKGDISTTEVEIITPGGIVGEDMEIETPSLELNVGDVGVFLVQQNTLASSLSGIPENLKFESSYAASQGFIKYDLVEKTANDVFHTYINIEIEVYNNIMMQAGRIYKEIKKFNINETGYYKSDKSILAPAIMSFTPTTITAGTLSVLTISGSGFGASYTGSAKVEFKDADNGGSGWTANNAGNIISWSATQIQVQVPKKAGTGQIRVTDNTGAVVTSTSTLNIVYAQLVALSSGVENRLRLANKNSAGGYTLTYNSTFNSNTAAVDAFERALSTWRCTSYCNYAKAATTTTVNCNLSDGINVITFPGSSCTLSSSILGSTTTYYSSCSSGGGSYWTLKEIDMRLNSTTNWNYGPGSTTGGKYDFESVCLHELGHAMLQAHVIKTVDLMHYASFPNNQIRVPDADAVACENEIVSRSITSYPCSPTAMTKISSSGCLIDIGNHEQHNNIVSFYPNPFGNSTVLHTGNIAGKQITLVLFDLLGNKVKQVEINSEDYVLNRDNMISGMYFYQLMDKENVVSAGKLIVTE
ncbi:MAG: T9SS type A sorting domain-containing protein [Bacteroidales bacterium]|nr:T9SS type A sorting domain-containing protein [Bacteroidales bacterium]